MIVNTVFVLLESINKVFQPLEGNERSKSDKQEFSMALWLLFSNKQTKATIGFSVHESVLLTEDTSNSWISTVNFRNESWYCVSYYCDSFVEDYNCCLP